MKAGKRAYRCAISAVIDRRYSWGLATLLPLDPATREAAEIAWLYWVFMAVCGGIFALVMLWLGIAIVRGRKNHAMGVAYVPPVGPEPERERRMMSLVVGAVVASVVVLFSLLVADFSVGRALHPPQRGDALTVRITGHQWWWSIEYLDRDPSKTITTANELHLPVGRPVQLLLQSADVIHSFWLPNLHGKRDLVPGQQTALWLNPERPGVYRGQCSEFCGHQHAHMGLLAVVESAEDFAKWQEAQRASAPPPQSESEQRGQQVFLSRTCVMCHTIQGTPAQSRVGPPLTHLASRQTLAAGAFPNTRGHLGGWILDPQAMKPGVRMPPNELTPDDLHALLDYLQSLK